MFISYIVLLLLIGVGIVALSWLLPAFFQYSALFLSLHGHLRSKGIPKKLEGLSEDWMSTKLRYESAFHVSHAPSGSSITLSLAIKKNALHTQCKLLSHRYIPVDLQIHPIREVEEEWRYLPASTPIRTLLDGFLPSWDASPSHFSGNAILLSIPGLTPSIEVRGVEEELLAIWNHEHSTRLRELIQVFGFSVEDKEIRYSQIGVPDANDLNTLLVGMVAFTTQLSVLPEEIMPRLRDNVQSHPNLAARLRSLELLHLLAPDDENTHEVSRYMLAQPLPQGQMTAALFLADALSDEDAWRHIEECLLEERLLIDTEHKVWKRLRRRETKEKAMYLLRICLDSSSSEESRNNKLDEARELMRVASLIDEAKAQCLPYLEGYLAANKHHQIPLVEKQIVQAYGKYGDERQEEALCDMLFADHTEVQVAAAAALQRVGTPTAIASLTRCIQMTCSDQDKQPFRNALAGIQSRFTHLDAGQLALIDEESEQGGAVSVVEQAEQEGAMSLAEESKGEVSLLEDTEGHASLVEDAAT